MPYFSQNSQLQLIKSKCLCSDEKCSVIPHCTLDRDLLIMFTIHETNRTDMGVTNKT